MKKTKEDIVLGTIKYICIAALLIVVLFPIIWLVAGSFKLEKEILSFPPTVFGEHFSMKSFQRIFDAIPFLQYIANTVIFALGAMLATGAATRFALERHEGKHADGYLAEALAWAGILSVPFILLGIFSAEGIVRLLGGEPDIVTVGAPYTRIFLLFTPFFMCNYILRSFVLNDGDPSLAMTATMASSLFNIVMDWVLMFPLGMGMAGAALATAASPIVGMGINALHFRKNANTLRFRWHKPTFKLLAHVSAVAYPGSSGNRGRHDDDGTEFP